ncbi:hypothetical protein [Bordetella pertussis]|nr:hypothetical protein [Bordetella pertussis]ETH76246.1 hypothetical protein L555_0199 [Bordetella pertussis STO1-CHOC-0008]
MYAWFIRTGFEKPHLQTQPGRIQPIDSSHLGGAPVLDVRGARAAP